MMRGAIERALAWTRTVWAAAGLTLAIGLTFTFVWAPHPWGWRGIDQYHQLAVALARGGPFGTTDVPWAYAYYVAAFYAVFGEQPWLPVTVQVVANAFVPVLLYELAAPLAGRRIAVLAAVLTGVFSFNTVYASTQSSDALCTIAFLASLVLLARGRRSGHWTWYAASGLVAGLVPQFRPNLILLPPVLAAADVWFSRDRRRTVRLAALYLAMVALTLAPWTLRNYRLTGLLLPTSTHGGVQLWYGTLQTDEYLESRAYNPRSVFETPAFAYTSVPDLPIIVSAAPRGCAPGTPLSAALLYRTDRQPAVHRVRGTPGDDGRFVFEIPGQPVPTAVYYWFETDWAPGDDGRTSAFTPAAGTETPFVFFVSDDHLGDLDRHDDLLDVFDVARLVRHLAWGESDGVDEDLDGDGRTDDRDLALALRTLLGDAVPAGASPRLEAGGDVATLTLPDDSVLRVPRTLTRVTDLAVAGSLATALIYARQPRWRLADEAAPALDVSCLQLEDITVNEPFHRREPHLMRRYTALAWDNIRRDPGGFLAASAYRAVRLFLIRGSADEMTTQQFDSSRAVYTAGTVLSAVYFALFVAGVIVCIRRRSPALALVIPIVYVPATICFVLTNMRYTLTMQPLMFVFVAAAILRGAGIGPQGADGSERWGSGIRGIRDQGDRGIGGSGSTGIRDEDQGPSGLTQDSS